jgi:mono/diheme cytochrome c family protein
VDSVLVTPAGTPQQTPAAQTAPAAPATAAAGRPPNADRQPATNAAGRKVARYDCANCHY